MPADQAEAVRKLDLPGIALTPGYSRFYPRQFLASQVLGSVGTDGSGLMGLEYRNDHALEGSSGRRRLVKDALGQSIEVRDTKPAKPGAKMELTIDAAIQDKVERVLADVGETYRPRGATAIVMNPNDGEVLALANWPRVDANKPSTAPSYAVQDRAVGFTYEPGSTFKAFTVAGALQDGKVTPDTPFDLAPQIQVADRTIGESHPRGPERLTTAQILAQSSQRRRDHDRPAPGRAALRLLGAQVRLRQEDGRRPARARSAASCSRGQVLGLVDGQPADRPGRVGHADADGRGLLGDRQRRRPARAALVRRVDGKLLPGRRAGA